MPHPSDILGHLGAIVGAIVLTAVACVAVWYNRTALTLPVMVFVAALLAVALYLAIPARADAAADRAVALWQKIRAPQPPSGGGQP